MKIMRDKPKTKGWSVLISMAVVTAISCTSFAIAFLWQRAQQHPFAPAQSGTASMAISPDSEPQNSSPLDSSELLPQNPDETALTTEQHPQVELAVQTINDGNTPEFLRERLSGALSPSSKVDNAYFSDAIFFGDSLSTGIPIYKVAGGPDTVAVRGASTHNALNEPIITLPDGEEMTMLEAAKQYGEKRKVYIMLGSNGLWMDQDSFAKGYREFISAVKAQYPGATVYLQSIPPVTTEAYKLYPTADNEIIRGLNEVVAQVARQSGVHFVDVAQALVDADGNLPIEGSPLDGMHLTPEYYQKWFEYLKTHTAEGGR